MPAIKTSQVQYSLQLLLAIITIYSVYFSLIPLVAISRLVQKIANNKFIFYKIDSWVIAVFFKMLLKLFKVKIIIEQDRYQHRKLDCPIIYISNHCSMFDIPILYQYCSNTTRMIASDEVFLLPQS